MKFGLYKMKKENSTSRVFSSFKMRSQFLIIAATLASCLALPPKHSNNLKIYGGKTAEPGQFPFIVSINLTANAQEFCAGAIIHENWILTTATCSELYGLKADQLVVVSGTNQFDTDPGVLYNVSQIVVHPNYTVAEDLPEENIALYQIDGSFAFSDLVQAVALGDVSGNDSVVVAGWGYTETGLNPALQYAELTAWSNEDCTKAVEARDIQPGEVCAFGGEGVGLCGGDIADPLVHDGALVGLGSWAIKACGGGKPDVYTRVSYYKDWINKVING